MSYPSSISGKYANPYVVASAPANERVGFYKRVYLHTAGALMALIALETVLVHSPLAPAFLKILGTTRFAWAIVLGVFMFVSYIADRWARSSTSVGTQYLGLGVYVVAEALIILPLVYMASLVNSQALSIAAVVTLFLFLGITVIAFTTKADFSFMGGFLKIAFMVAVGAIFASIFFNFNMGIWFSAAMCLLLGGSLLYTTSNIIHHYNTTQHVAAALSLFAGVATLFYYILQIVLSIMGRK